MRTYQIGEPCPMVVELHDHDCGCAACEPRRPSVPRRLDAGDFGRLTLAGFATGHVVAAAIWGWRSVVAALWSAVSGQPL